MGAAVTVPHPGMSAMGRSQSLPGGKGASLNVGIG